MEFWYIRGRHRLALVLSILALATPPSVSAQADKKPRTAEQKTQIDRATELNREALALHKAGKSKEALKPAQEALDIRKRVLGETHPGYAQSLNTLATIHQALGQFTLALPLYQQALDIRKKSLGAKSKEYVTSLNALALAYAAQGDYVRAEPLLVQARDILKETVGAGHANYAGALSNLGSLYSRKSDYARAEPLFREALEVTKKLDGAQHPNYASSLSQLAGVHKGLGDFERAEKLTRQALEIRKKAFGDHHPSVAATLINLANVYESAGDYGRAEALFQQALDIRKQVLGEKHPDYARSLSHLAQAYQYQEKLDRAEPLYEQALDILKRTVGVKSPSYANALGGMAALYKTQGDYARAETLYRQVLDINKQTLGVRHPAYATTLSNLASLYGAQNDHERALPLDLEALSITGQALGKNHPDYALRLNNLAGAYKGQGDLARAEKYYLQAIDIYEQAFAGKHPFHALLLRNLATVQHAQKQAGPAKANYCRALDMRTRLLGEQHPHTALSLCDLAQFYWDQKDYARAEPLFRAAIGSMALRPKTAAGSVQDSTPADFRLQPEILSYLTNYAGCLRDAKKWREANEALALAIGILDRLRGDKLEQQESKLFHAAKSEFIWPMRLGILAELQRVEPRPGDAQSTYWTVEQGSARVFLETLGRARRHAIAGIPDKTAEDERQRTSALKAIEHRIDIETARPIDKRDQKRIDQLFGELRQVETALQQLRARLEKEHPSYAALKYPRPCTLDDARAALAPHEIALWFVAGRNASFIVTLNAAAEKDHGIAIVRIARQATIEETIAALTDPQTLASQGRTRAIGAQAYEMILKPVAERIRGKNLVIVPGATFAPLPFELLVEPNLPKGDASEGRFLIENHGIRYAPSLTALHVLRRWDRARPRPTKDLWAMGDPIYQPEDARLKGQPAVFATARSTSGPKLARLAHSGTETGEIAKLWGPGQTVVGGVAATEYAVKKASAAGELAKHRFIHFATHGLLGVDAGRPPSLVLNLVGISSGEDGYLQMDEVTGLKLNADVVVLSACQTGKGRIARGEGVLGLAQSFLYAGSKGVVCSLWSVDDRETSNLMIDFYGHLKKGLPAADALRQAQLAMIRAGKAPLFWAPFILIGE